MPVYIDTPKHKYSFTLIRIVEASYKLFLKSDDPKVKMLGILANFDKEDGFSAVKTIVNEVQSAAKGDFAKSRHINQLRIFVQLRSNIKQEFGKVMESVPKFFKEEDDFLYKKGEIKGETKGEIKGEERKTHAVVQNLIIKLGLSDEQAADVAAVSSDYVAKIRAELKSK